LLFAGADDTIRTCPIEIFSDLTWIHLH
jgi:hypothetical protein